MTSGTSGLAAHNSTEEVTDSSLFGNFYVYASILSSISEAIHRQSEIDYLPSAFKSSSKFSDDFIFHFPEKSAIFFSILFAGRLIAAGQSGLRADLLVRVCPPPLTGS